jgi:hypothetical protein
MRVGLQCLLNAEPALQPPASCAGTGGTVFAATLVRYCYGLSGCWPPCTDLTDLPANGGFYIQAFDGSVTLPLDMTTTVTGLLCWRDFHPLEWQLASLHWSGRTDLQRRPAR